MEGQVFYLINRDMKDLFNVVSPGLILDEENFTKLLDNKDNVGVIVIFAELTWNKKKPSDFYGFDIAYELRTKHKLLSPIIIISAFKQSYFETLDKNQEFTDLNKMKYKILFARGTGFVTLGENTDQEIKDIIQQLNQFPLSPSVLTDINEMLLNVRGFIIDKLTHDLRAGKSKDEINAIFTEISRYLDVSRISSLDLEKYKSDFLKQIDNPYAFNKIKENFILKCNQELLGESIPDGPVYYKRHRIIVLEDNPDFGQKIIQNLRDYFEEIVLTEKAQDAIELINQDEENSITGILTDWRLYEDYSKKTYWQMQGYEVLNYAALNRFIALFSLTSIYDRYVNDIRNQLGIEINIFKKQYLDLEGAVQWNILGDIVRQKCDIVSEIIASQPTGATWNNFKLEYISKRNFDWFPFENNIAEKATELFQHYLKAIEDNDYRLAHSLSDVGLFLKNDLGNVLIVRRIYFGLYCKLVIERNYLQDIIPPYLLSKKNNNKIKNKIDTESRHHSIDAYSLLRKDWWDDLQNGLDSRLIDETWEKFDQRIKNFKSSLCMELSGFPNKGILPEEKNWFIKNNIDYSLLSELNYLD